MSGQRSLSKDPRDRKDVSARVGEDWLRVANMLGKGTFADKIGVGCTQTVNNAITGPGLPELHTALNSLLADPTALFNTLMLFGGVFVPVEAGTCDDNAVIAQMLHTVTDYFERMKDGTRCHQDTLALAELFRPLVPAMLCVIVEANAIKGGQG